MDAWPRSSGGSGVQAPAPRPAHARDASRQRPGRHLHDVLEPHALVHALAVGGGLQEGEVAAGVDTVVHRAPGHRLADATAAVTPERGDVEDLGHTVDAAGHGGGDRPVVDEAEVEPEPREREHTRVVEDREGGAVEPERAASAIASAASPEALISPARPARA